VILSNGNEHWFWNYERADQRDAFRIERMPSLQDLERLRLKNLQPPRPLLTDVIAPNYLKRFKDEISLHRYQINAIDKVAKQFDRDGKRKFLLEMATGTGKTLLCAALIRRFLATRNAERVLFIVDRIELAKQTMEEFCVILREYSPVIFKTARRHPSELLGSCVVVATIQSLLVDRRYRLEFTPFYFDLVINNEAHRSIYGDAREVVQFFQATRVGLPATLFPTMASFSMATTPTGARSRLPLPASLDGLSDRSSGKTSIREDTSPFSRFFLPARAPFGAQLQQDQRSSKEGGGEKEKSPRILPGSLFNGSESKRQEKASQATSRTDQPSKNPDALRESLRQKLKNGSIPHAHHAHGEKQERHLHRKRRETPYTSEATRHKSQEQQEQAVACDFVREPSAHGPQETSRKDNEDREVANAKPPTSSETIAAMLRCVAFSNSSSSQIVANVPTDSCVSTVITTSGKWACSGLARFKSAFCMFGGKFSGNVTRVEEMLSSADGSPGALALAA
jgi:hypothetical protein